MVKPCTTVRLPKRLDRPFTAKKGIVLCTGDYGSNPEMVDAWAPILKKVESNLYTPVGANVGDGIYLPILDRNNTFQYMGSLTWTHAAHNIKAGAQFTRRQLNYFQSSNPLGFVGF